MRIGDGREEIRASALWGSGKRGNGSRSNALWGSGKRGYVLLAALALAVTAPFEASAAPGPPKPDKTAYVTPSLLTAAQANAASTFRVIVQGRGGNQAAHAVADALGTSLKTVRTFQSIDGVAVELTGAQILALVADKHGTAVTDDARVRLAANSGADPNEKWPFVNGVNKYTGAPAATIAIVDSGIDASRPEFA